MKNLILLLCLTFSLQALSSMEADNFQEATPAEIAASRACFQEVADQGCGHPRDDLPSFKSCLHSSFSTLTPNCQKMMGELYGKK